VPEIYKSKMEKKFNFEIGFIPEDRHQIDEFIHELNEDSDPVYFVKKIREYDDPDGYYTYSLIGSEEAYKCFMGYERIKSLNHYLGDQGY